MINVVIDNGGRRSGIERRGFSYAIHVPELRLGKDRRNGIDRRNIKKAGLKMALPFYLCKQFVVYSEVGSVVVKAK